MRERVKTVLAAASSLVFAMVIVVSAPVDVCAESYEDLLEETLGLKELADEVKSVRVSQLTKIVERWLALKPGRAVPSTA